VALDTPSLGEYSSLDMAVVRRHCEMAKGSGIDGFVISLWKDEVFGGWERFKRVSEILEKCGLKYTVYVEDQDPSWVAKKLLKMKDRKNLLRIDRRVVIFVYARVSDKLSLSQRRSIRKLSDSVIFFLHGFNALNGFTSGSMHSYVDFKNDVKTLKERCDYTHAFGGLCAVPVSPGFKMRKSSLRISRKNGEFYRWQWRRAIGSGADVILVTSFNEWEEGTQIEPAKGYGNLYLDITRNMAYIFKENYKSHHFHFRAVRLSFKGQVCYISGNSSKGGSPIPLLLKIHPPKNVKKCDILIHDMGELYQSHLIPILVEYVRTGGTMILAGGPYPLYKSVSGDKKLAIGSFNIRIGFGRDLSVGEKVMIEGPLGRFRFFVVGDKRLRTLENPDETLFYLVRDDRREGTVVGIKRFGKGRIVYLWKGIREQPYLPSILRWILKRFSP